MNNYSKYFRNKSFKRTSILLFLTFSIFIFMFFLFFYKEMQTLNKSYIEQNTLIVGNILSKNPELENQVIDGIINKKENKDLLKNKNYVIGKQILSRYSYSDKLSIFNNPPLKNVFKSFSFKLGILLLYLTLSIFFILTINQINFFKQLDIFSRAAQRVVEGKFEKLEEKFLEGEFYIFTCEFNLMVDRLKSSVENLKKEKLFLKNIISDISHQLKTPLSSLIMFNELMANKNIGESDRDNFVKLSFEQLQRMEWLIKNLLKLSRLEAGVINFNKEKNPLYITINKSVSGLIKKAEEKHISININVSKNIFFNHDMDWTAEAFSNIIKNAIEHTDENGSIDITAYDTPISVNLKIRDNGVGIAKEEIGKIFKRFYKGSSEVNANSIGIGLALCKSIIESQNGSINVNSKLNEGTEFEIIFLKTVV